MIMILAAALAAQPVMPYLDRASLDMLSKAESLQARKASTSLSAKELVRTRRLSTIVSICGAASKQADPAAFIGVVGHAFALSASDVSTLRESCAVYLAGRAETSKQWAFNRR